MIMGVGDIIAPFRTLFSDDGYWVHGVGWVDMRVGVLET